MIFFVTENPWVYILTSLALLVITHKKNVIVDELLLKQLADQNLTNQRGLKLNAQLRPNIDIIFYIIDERLEVHDLLLVENHPSNHQRTNKDTITYLN